MSKLKTKSLNCPQCGGTMTVDANHDQYTCPFCGHVEVYDHVETAEEAGYRAERIAYGQTKGILEAQRHYGNVGYKKKNKGTGILATIVTALLLFAIIFGINSAKDVAKPECDPFEFAEVSFSGTDGYGTAKVTTHPIDGSEVNPKQIRYTVVEKSLSEGDIITVKASSDNYRLSQTEKQYTVSGLDLYITEKSQMTADVKDYIEQKSLSIMEQKLKYNPNRLSGATLNVDGYTKDHVRTYVASKDHGNIVVDVYCIHFTKDDNQADRYFAIAYTNCVVPQKSDITVMTINSYSVLGKVIEAMGGIEEIGGKNMWGAYAGYFTGYFTLSDADTAIREIIQQSGYRDLFVVEQ